MHVLAEHKPGSIELTFEDDGTPFNPLAAPPPDSFTSPETAKIGGLGIHLVAGLSSAVRYEQCSGTARAGEIFNPSNRLVISVAT
jgi:anti-sigma regulatory factor (Ser/Thr protein kinase)